ncbi:trans-sulfuration enzyme family protein [Paenibacillus nasutitermitis]|uniref:homocysteine desulfhydrase n=1 Tax=Paenibacillus nasutitermitis TaxID=1652958 RepID=A0A917DNN5_9BACL|nr:aminotransferase class I/II-fold pyridoxal phosphate-dependent enzyme [Paenibacillus nasutitermitis]GGD51876.1 cystathionine gamma-synthase [Paenibacillus nasutitermitis]
MNRTENQEDICTHYADEYDKYLGAIVPPIFQNTLFTHKTENHGYSYTRANNPTIEIAERKIAALEGGESAACFSSGVAAISAAILHWLAKDDHLICVSSVYPRTRALIHSYLDKFGITATFVPGHSIEEFEHAIQPNTKLIYLESPSSIIFAMQDLAAVAELAQTHGIVTMIDNTWATPLFQNPLHLGIDVAIHSATKYLGGHSDILGGVVVGRADAIKGIVERERGLLGAIMDPHQAWLLIRSLRTLPVRMKQHQENARKMAAFLETHAAVSQVFYPGLPSHPQYEIGRKQMSGFAGVMSFIVKASYEQLDKMLHGLMMYEMGASWGGFESLISGIAIDEPLSVYTGLPVGTPIIRVSVGLENIDSLIADLHQGLDRLLL